MYDILVYLFENCQQAELAYDRERVARKLSAAGFEDSDISEALHWLAGVVRAPQGALREPLPDAIRLMVRALSVVPTRHGVQKPQLSCAKKRVIRRCS